MAHNLKDIPKAERPRERLARLGSSALSSIELLAVLLGSGTKGKSVLLLAQELLAHFGSLNGLLEASIEDLCQVKGLGVVKAIQLKAALSLANRIAQENIGHKKVLDTPLKTYLWVKDLIAQEKKEIFAIVLLNARGEATHWEVISIGTLTQTLVHPREVFYPAIRHLAASIILVHNHPSGDPTPSDADCRLTRQLLFASQAIGIPVLDHLIVGTKGFVSLKEKGFPWTSEMITP